MVWIAIATFPFLQDVRRSLCGSCISVARVFSLGWLFVLMYCASSIRPCSPKRFKPTRRSLSTTLACVFVFLLSCDISSTPCLVKGSFMLPVSLCKEHNYSLRSQCGNGPATRQEGDGKRLEDRRERNGKEAGRETNQHISISSITRLQVETMSWMRA